MSPLSRRAAKLTAIQQEQARALQEKINAESYTESRRIQRWEDEKDAYLQGGNPQRLAAAANAFYADEMFMGLPQIVTRVAAEIGHLTSERAVRVILERQTPRIEVGPNDIVATGGLIKRGAVLPLLGDPGPSPRPYGEPTVLDYPTVIPENDCA